MYSKCVRTTFRGHAGDHDHAVNTHQITLIMAHDESSSAFLLFYA